MDWDNAPSTLHTELFEESGSDDAGVGNKAVRVEQGTSNDGNKDDGEAAAEDGGAVPDDCATAHGA